MQTHIRDGDIRELTGDVVQLLIPGQLFGDDWSGTDDELRQIESGREVCDSRFRVLQSVAELATFEESHGVERRMIDGSGLGGDGFGQPIQSDEDPRPGPQQVGIGGCQANRLRVCVQRLPIGARLR